LEEVNPLIALYSLFEKLFFSQQGPTRQNNAFCYEITDLLPNQVKVTPEIKYCAFNVAPIERQLTVEFRHGEFRKDMRFLRRWIQLVCKFMNFAGTHKQRMKGIVQSTIVSDEYLKLFKSVFGRSTILFEGQDVFNMMKSNALWAATLLESV
jgi:hypothetical protein